MVFLRFDSSAPPFRIKELLNIDGKKPYLCICIDCSFRFQSEQVPIPKLNIFSLLKRKTENKSSLSEVSNHCVQATLEMKTKTNVNCPSCGSKNISLLAVMD